MVQKMVQSVFYPMPSFFGSDIWTHIFKRNPYLIIGHTWKTDHNVPWQVLVDLKQSTYYCTIFGGQKRNYHVKLGKTPDCCKILTAQLNGLYCVTTSVKIRQKHIFFLAPHGAPRWYSFHSVNHTWKSYKRFRITYLHTDPVFEVFRLPNFRLFSKCLSRKTHLSPAPVVVDVLSRIQKSCKEYLRLWTLTSGIVTTSKTSKRPRGLPWRRRLITFRW